jgi:hypothetical protein
MAKFARGNRYSQMEYQEKYKEECRKIFEVQTKSLTSTNVPSTDNETSADEDSDVDEMSKNLESMLEPTVAKPNNEHKSHADTTDTMKKTVSQYDETHEENQPRVNASIRVCVYVDESWSRILAETMCVDNI